ncbi:MAG: amidohydrolase family protein [Phycisphaerales bacterium]
MTRTSSLTTFFAAALGAVCAPNAGAQDLSRRPGPQEMPIALTHATIHTVSGQDIPDGFILFDRGIITEVGSMSGGRAFIGTVRQIDCRGKHVYPSLISPSTQTGLVEHGMTRPSMDFREVGDLTPEVTAATAVNPDSTLLPVTRANGVLVCGVFPTGGIIPGRASVIRLEGWTWEEMTVERHAGLALNWPMARTVTAWWMDRSEDDQRRDNARAVERIRDALRAARAYLAAKDGPDGANLPTDLRWEAMRRVLGEMKPSSPGAGGAAAGLGQIPVFISATDYDQISSAVAWAIEERLKPVIVGGRDAHLCADLLKRHDVPVIINSTLAMPRRDDSPIDEAFSLPARLQSAGVRWCLASGEETPHERNLPYAAALAVANGGLAHADALRGITLSTAEILGVADRLGSLEQGKEATLVVADGDILEVTTRVEAIYIQGKNVPTTTKQSELAEKYREKYRQQRPATGEAAGSGGTGVKSGS